MSEDVYLDQINIVVRDIEKSAAFYARLGLKVGDESPPEWQPHHREAPTEGADLGLDSAAFTAQWNQGWPGGSGLVMSFRVPTRDHVDRLYADLVADGHVAQQSPYDAFWGARFAIIADPDGNAVGLMSPPDPGRQSRPVPPE